MGYRVSGILKLPDGTPANNAEIEFISRKNFSPLVQELKSNVKCSATGAYDVTLEYGEYAVIVYPGCTYPAALGTIILAADTVAGYDLPTLLQQEGWQPATPEYIVQIQGWLLEAAAHEAASAASEVNAKASELAAKSSEISVEADRSEVASNKDIVVSAQADVTAKAAQASSSASLALSSKNTAVAAADTATQKAAAAAASEASASASAAKAENAANVVVGALIDAGPYSASSGVLPTPVMSGTVKLSSIWKVTANGVAGGIDLGIGDSLVYTARDNSYYKIDNTESVTKVNNKTGVVVLSSSDVGADPAGTASGLVSQHAAKANAHPISGVAGLPAALDSKYSPTNKPTAADVGADPSGTALSVQLPAPDVSIPFCQDLEMSAGLGYDTMQIGADTLSIPGINLVAYQRLGSQTMIDKSGRLVTVGANRPAIEQQGIAIYDQSVNLAAPSINWSASANAAGPWVHGAVDEFGWRSVSGSGDTSKTEGSYKDFSVPTAGTPLTLSLDILKTTGLNVRIRTYGHESGAVDVSLSETAVTGAGGADVYDMGHYWRVELTRSFSGSTRLFRIYPFGTLAGSSGAMSYRRVQLEAKPFATPYIENETSAQTARPATTRCDIPWRGNMQPISDTQQLTIALEFDTAGQPSSGYHTLLANGYGSGNYLQIRVEAGGLLRAYRSASATHQPVVAAKRRYRLCYRVNRNTCDMFLDGVKFGSPVTVAPLSVGMPQLLRIGYASITDRCLNGHLRSIAIWNAPLTDIQCQAASAP